MIDDYFENLEKTILDFKQIIMSYSIFKKAYNDLRRSFKPNTLDTLRRIY